MLWKESPALRKITNSPFARRSPLFMASYNPLSGSEIIVVPEISADWARGTVLSVEFPSITMYSKSLHVCALTQARVAGIVVSALKVIVMMENSGLRSMSHIGCKLCKVTKKDCIGKQ